jgi:hypothetical protein
MTMTPVGAPPQGGEAPNSLEVHLWGLVAPVWAMGDAPHATNPVKQP